MATSVRRLPLIAVLLGLAALAMLPAAAQARVQLVLSSVTEPPDVQVRGGQWRLTATVANEGATSSRLPGGLVFYLSLGRRFSSDDLQRKLADDVTYPRLRAGRQATRRGTLKIPNSIPDGKYFLVSCIGSAAVGSDDLNCRFSGQILEINPTGVLAAGSAGPAGPAGAAGPAGPQGDPAPANQPGQTVPVPRTVLDTGFANIDEGGTEPRAVPADPTTDASAHEGSTQAADLATVGPFTFRALCREGMPFEPFNNGSRGVDEAKVVVYHNASGETMVIDGIHGSRANVPAGRGTAGTDNALGGEGQHMVFAAYRQRDEGFSALPADNALIPDDGDADTTPQPDTNTPTERYVSGFDAGTAVIALSNGWAVSFTGWAGLDVLGEGTPDNVAGQNYPDDDENLKTGEDDACVFGGTVTIHDSP